MTLNKILSRIRPFQAKPITIVQHRMNSNDTLKPFSLLKTPPFILPSNPLSLMWSQLTRGFQIKFEMAKVDPTFSMTEFHSGAQMAVSTVSNRIASGRFDELTDLVDGDLLGKIKNRYGTLTSQEKDLIPIEKPNVASQRVIEYELLKSYQNKGPFVKFTLLFYMMNLQNIELGDKNLSVDEYFKQQVRNLMMAEYTFVRDYTPGNKNSDWLITELNHYNSDYYGMAIRDRN